MAAAVAIVTDSTAYLPEGLARRHRLTIVPLQIVIGGAASEEGVDITAADTARALRRWDPVTTSRPSPQRFADAYGAAAATGARGIVSVHLSAAMSGTVEHLHRGGRIGAAATLLGSALMVKPLLGIADGRIVPLEKVRTASRALSRMEDLAVDFAGDLEVDVAVQHLGTESRAQALAGRLHERISRLGVLHVGQAGPVMGAHAGPGMLGVVVAPR
jgi:fatty acid-binding protein DegV